MTESKYYTIKRHHDIDFYDFQPTFSNPERFKEMIEMICDKITLPINYFGLLDSKGFIWGSALTYKLECPFIPIRKKGKLPPPVFTSDDYKTVYDKVSNALEIPADLIPGDIILIDDVIESGKTLLTAYDLLKKNGYNVLYAVVIVKLGNPELPFEVKSVL